MQCLWWAPSASSRPRRVFIRVNELLKVTFNGFFLIVGCIG